MDLTGSVFETAGPFVNEFLGSAAATDSSALDTLANIAVFVPTQILSLIGGVGQLLGLGSTGGAATLPL